MFLVLGSCEFFFGGGDDASSNPPSDPVGDWSASSWTEHGSLGGTASLTVGGSYAGRDLIYVYTNYGETSAQSSLPAANTVAGSAAAAERLWMRPGADGMEYQPVSSLSTQSVEADGPIAQRGHPGITAANRELLDNLERGSVSAAQVSSETDYDVGATETMIAWAELDNDLDGDGFVTTTPVEVNVTLQAKQSQDGWDFYIWLVTGVVAGYEAYDELVWDSTDDGDLTQSNIGAMAQIFLDNTVDNDVFDLVTNAFGVPWGSHPYSNLVSGTERNVHVLLYDIDGDRIVSGESRIVGFFYGVDNFTDSGGNGLVMFHLDAALFGTEDATPPDGWDITDYWPAQVVSTLAHEFQHMIHFYQRGIVPADGSSDGSFETWIDEANSMMAEDLVAQAIENNGPRGVAYTDGTAGSSGNPSGRIPDYVAYGSETQLTDFHSSDDVLKNYSTSYAFGAYLGRVFGAEFFTDLMGNSTASGSTNLEYTTTAIAQAASTASGTSVDFPELMRRWGVAYLVSDDVYVPSEYRINQGDWFDSSSGGESYQLGSINAYNYSHDYGSGIMAYNAATGAVPAAAGANSFAVAGTVPAGGYTVSVSLPANTTLTVLTR